MPVRLRYADVAQPLTWMSDVIGLIVAVILQGSISQPDGDGNTTFASFAGFASLAAGRLAQTTHAARLARLT